MHTHQELPCRCEFYDYRTVVVVFVAFFEQAQKNTTEYRSGGIIGIECAPEHILNFGEYSSVM